MNKGRTFTAIRTFTSEVLSKNCYRQASLNVYGENGVFGYSKPIKFAPKRSLFLSATCNEKITINVPKFDEAITQGDIFFEKKVGDSVKVDERIGTIETDKISVAVQSSVAGKIAELLVNDGESVECDKPIVTIETDESIVVERTDDSQSIDASIQQSKDDEEIARTHDNQNQAPIKLDTNVGTEERDHPESTEHEFQHTPRQTIIPPVDFKTKSSALNESTALQAGTKPPPFNAGIIDNRQEILVRMSRMRSRIAERLKNSQNTMACLTTFNEIDMSAIMKLRKDYGDQFARKHSVKLGFMSAFVQASVQAIVECPSINAFINEHDKIVYRNYIDVGIAVSTPKGLVVPVIRNAHSMSMVDFEKLIFAYGEKAKSNNITMEDMDGGTFTISNGGIFGGLMGTPIINERQSAILGIYGIKDRPVAVNGKVEIHPMTYVALTYDHRLIDGREAVTFLGRIKQIVEDPVRKLLEV